MDTTVHVRKSLNITLDPAHVAELLRVPEDIMDEFMDIFDECAKVADPKYIFTQREVRQEGDVTYVGESSFDSHIMAVNMKDVTVAWPYICTCGRELYDLAQSKDDPLERYWVDQISEQYLHHAGALANAEIKQFSGKETLYSINPGSPKEFHISNQRPLFAIFGDTEALCGAGLTPTFLILPYKSSSGIYYDSEVDFNSCAICHQENCPNRRAPFDEMLLAARYAVDGK